MSKFIDGKKLAAELRHYIAQYCLNHNLSPRLSIIMVGDHVPSQIYVQQKLKACNEVGIKLQIYQLPTTATKSTVQNLLLQLNEDSQTHGILLQLPLPDHLSTWELLQLIHPNKDVDGLTAVNQGRLMQGHPLFIPCTPQGCIRILSRVEPSLSGKNIIVIGRSLIVGRPLATLLSLYNATVTLAHSYTINLKQLTRSADIIISAIGKPHFINEDFIGDNKPIILDVGLSKSIVDGRYYGDVNDTYLYDKVQALTPVPGGVGPMTVACLLYNSMVANLLEHQPDLNITEFFHQFMTYQSL